MDAFKTEQLVPDMIDEVPGTLLQVTYNGTDVTPGHVMTPTQVKDEPQVRYHGEEGQFYTLLFHDPDAPSRADPQFGEVQHWFVGNIPGSDVSKGVVLTAYRGSGAPKGTGLHRYVFLLYKQHGQIDFSEVKRIPNNSVEGRRCQKVRNISDRFGLTLVAGTFFQAEWDEYVPILKAQTLSSPPDVTQN